MIPTLKGLSSLNLSKESVGNDEFLVGPSHTGALTSPSPLEIKRCLIRGSLNILYIILRSRSIRIFVHTHRIEDEDTQSPVFTLKIFHRVASHTMRMKRDISPFRHGSSLTESFKSLKKIDPG